VRALSSALESVRPGGTITVVGLYADEVQFSLTSAVRRELSLLFSYSCNYADYQTSLDLLGRGDIDPGPLLSKYPLEEAPELSRRLGRTGP
jgi:L-iditol 2-dehydrogenase